MLVVDFHKVVVGMWNEEKTRRRKRLEEVEGRVSVSMDVMTEC